MRAPSSVLSAGSVVAVSGAAGSEVSAEVVAGSEAGEAVVAVPPSESDEHPARTRPVPRTAMDRTVRGVVFIL